jgi:hypothetical protein
MRFFRKDPSVFEGFFSHRGHRGHTVIFKSLLFQNIKLCVLCALCVKKNLFYRNKPLIRWYCPAFVE